MYLTIKRHLSLITMLAVLLTAWIITLSPSETRAAGPVCFYFDINYAGASLCSGVGSYSTVPSGWNDQASSVVVPSGYKVELFANSSLSGTVLTLTANASSLVSRSFNDRMSSYRISTTSSGGGCSYSNWTAGVNYQLGAIVKYTANGNFYKVVNVGTNGSDGTDPTISTWYWDPTSCSGGSGSSPTSPPSGCSGFSCIVTEAQFNSMFPSRNGFYTYANLNSALSAYPGFAATGDTATRKREVAAFLANIHHESGGLVYIVEQNTANYAHYCDASKSYGCPAGGSAYYGRGPMQLSWNYNYYAAGNSIGVNLLNSPSLVATNGLITWKVALWFWNTQTTAAGTLVPHSAIVNGNGFGETIRTINGMECNGGNTAQMQSRVAKFNSFLSTLGSFAVGTSTC